MGLRSTSDGRQNEELDTQIGKTNTIMRALHYSVVMKRGLSKKAKPSIFITVFVPILTYGHESWVMIERVRSQASKMRFLQRIVVLVVFVAHIYPPVTGQRQTLHIERSAHVSLQQQLCGRRNLHLLRSFQ